MTCAGSSSLPLLLGGTPAVQPRPSECLGATVSLALVVADPRITVLLSRW